MDGSNKVSRPEEETYGYKEHFVVRDVSSDEEGNYYPYDVKKGDTVFELLAPTYGVCSPNGIMISEKPGKYPGYEFPKEALGLPTFY